MKGTPINIFEQGQVLLIDKPLEWTSFDVVARLRGLVRTRKIGHAGTLDPLATGLLILCTGRFTKRIHEFMAQEKEYTGTVTLGAVTPTYDLESEPRDHREVSFLTRTVVEELIARQFVGEIEQVPPAHSAIKVGGRRVYQLARKGKEVKLEPRRIRISAFEITGYRLPHVDFRVVCSTGTYIRSLAHDLGAALGCGGHLSALRRTRIGEYRVEQALSMQAAEVWIRGRLEEGSGDAGGAPGDQADRTGDYGREETGGE